MPGVACPFAAIEDLDWPVAEVSRIELAVPPFIIDFRPNLANRRELGAVADRLDPSQFAVLLGDHVDEVGNHTPPEMARALTGVGLRAIVTLSCRERDVDTLRRYIFELCDAGVDAVHCVTGDHPAARLGLSGDYNFPLDSFGLVSLARSLGAAVSVAESPAAWPTDRRPQRLAAKAAAGASLAILNHAGPPSALIDFADSCRELDQKLGLVAPVPVITDPRSATALANFPGLVLQPGLTDRILRSADPLQEGIEAAVEIGRTLRGSGRFAALNLSGIGANTGMVKRAELMAAVAAAIRSDDG